MAMAFSPKVRDVRPSYFLVLITESGASTTHFKSTFAATTTFNLLLLKWLQEVFILFLLHQNQDNGYQFTLLAWASLELPGQTGDLGITENRSQCNGKGIIFTNEYPISALICKKVAKTIFGSIWTPFIIETVKFVKKNWEEQIN